MSKEGFKDRQQQQQALASGAGIGAATFGTYQRLDDDWVCLRLRSARQDKILLQEAEPILDIRVMPFTTWQIVKRRIKELWPGVKAVPDANIRLLHKSVELRSCFMIADYNVEGGTKDQPVELQYLIIDQGSDNRKGGQGEGQGARNRTQGEGSIGLYVDAQVPYTQELRNRVQACLGAMLSGIQPRLTEEGTGATYMLRDSSNRHVQAVFKPKDEEAFAPQNPRGYVGQEDTPGLRSGVLSTQQAAREVAAYLLDHQQFANVPQTTLAHAKHPKFSKVRGKNGGEKTVWKIGAFQAFIETKDTSGNFAPQVFAVEDIHRIGMLDVRIVNLDRNDGNLLVRCHTITNTKGKYELVPIDHGLSLPDRLEVYTDDIVWMGWPQAQKPFGPKELTYIKGLNPQQDARQLSKYLGVRRECLRLMEVTTTLLQLGAEHGLTLYEIGSIMYRSIDFPDKKSKLEQVIDNCLNAALTVSGEKAAADAVSSTLAGLDLVASAGGRMVRQESTGTIQTPMMGPSSPVFSASSPVDMEADRWEPPPPFSLDQLSESEGPQEGQQKQQDWCPGDSFILTMGARAPCPSGGMMSGMVRQISGDEAQRSAQESPPPGTPATQPRDTPAPKPIRASGQSYRGGTRLRKSAALAALHREGEDKDAEGSIFARPGLRGSDWSPELEKAFRRQIQSELQGHIKKHFPKAAERAAAAQQADWGSPAAESPAAAADEEDLSLAGALPSVLPDDGSWLRAEKAAPATGRPGADGADADDAGGGAGAPGGDSAGGSEATTAAAAGPPKKKYVPPQVRRRQEAEAAEAAAAASAVADAAPAAD